VWEEGGEAGWGGMGGIEVRNEPCASGIDPGSTADRTTCCSCSCFRRTRSVCGVCAGQGSRVSSGAYRCCLMMGWPALDLVPACALGSRGVAVHLEEEEEKGEKGVSDLFWLCEAVVEREGGSGVKRLHHHHETSTCLCPSLVTLRTALLLNSKSNSRPPFQQTQRVAPGQSGATP